MHTYLTPSSLLIAYKPKREYAAVFSIHSYCTCRTTYCEEIPTVFEV
jgi:hypothetical protein